MLLPSLDRLAELVARVVDLLDELVTERHYLPSTPAEPPNEEAREGLATIRHNPSPPEGWVTFVPSPSGYRLAERDGVPPGRGAVVDVDGMPFRVLRLGPSPLPGDRRRCAFLEREERPEAARTFDR